MNSSDRAAGRTRLLYLVSHPIQYQAPLLQVLTERSNFDLTVGFTTTASTSRTDPGFARTITYDIPLLEGYSWFDARRGLLEAIQSTDVVWAHGWQGRRQLAAILLARILGKPVVLRSETWDGAYPSTSSFRQRGRRTYHKLVLRLGSAFLSIGTRNQQYLESCGCDRGAIFSVPYAVDNARFARGAAAADPRTIKKSLGLDPHRPVILYSGKLSERKLPAVLLRAYQCATWSGERPALVFVGDGELRGHLHTIANDDPDVHFLGFANQSELPALYACADVFVLASKSEPWGLAVNEAMASGTAVVVSQEVGAAVDLVTPDTGRVVPAGNHLALSQALVEILPTAEAMGRRAQERMEAWSFEEDLVGLEEAVSHVTAPLLRPKRRVLGKVRC